MSATRSKLWPLHLKPQDDEILSSWLVRLAQAHGLKPYSFCHLAWPGKSIWNRDIDKSADQDILTLLSDRTAVSEDRVFATTLHAYEGVISEHLNPFGHSRWILPVGVYHRTRTRYGLQFCPCCLAEDPKPYYRKYWRLGFVTVCTQHGCRLLDRCASCEGAVSPHRNSVDPDALTVCSTCGADFREFIPYRDEHTTEHVLFLTQLMEVMAQGYATLPTAGWLYAHLFFTGLHRIASLMASDRNGRRLRPYFRHQIPIPEQNYGSGGGILVIRLDTEARFAIMAMVQSLLADWPEHFLAFCHAMKLTSSDLLRDMREVPYWYEEIVKTHFYSALYVPSVIEVEEVIRYLRKHGNNFDKSDVSKLLGVQDVFRGRPELLRLLIRNEPSS